MQFSCESCKATLHIADEKVKGKRLVVRCKRCGNRIQIADPALGAAPPAAAPLQTSAGIAPAPARSAPAPAAAPGSAAAIRGAPVTAARRQELDPIDPHREGNRDTDTESTRAMDTAVLEEALRASKSDDPNSAPGPIADSRGAAAPGARPNGGRGPVAAAPPAAAPPAAAPPAAAPRDPPTWFAMIGGKQGGPFSRAEFALKTAQGATGPRTYVWKEGMVAWLRAKEVAELSGLFADAPAPRPAAAPPVAPPRPTPPPRQEPRNGGQQYSSASDFSDLNLVREEPKRQQSHGAEFSTQDFVGLDLEAEARKTAPKPAAQRPALAAQAAAPEPQAEPGPEISIEGLQRVAQEAPSQEESTNVEQLPLGERVHQEAVAHELFQSGEVSNTGLAAVDLAKWASTELSKKSGSSPELRRALAKPPVPSVPPGVLPAVKPDPFAKVPDVPGLKEPEKPETTGNIIARSGVQQKRTGLLVAVIGAGVLVIVVLLWALLGGDKVEWTAAAEVARPSLGGTGDTSVGGLAKNQGGSPGSGAEAAPARPGERKREGGPTKDPSSAPARPLTPEQEAALKALDNERGIGSYGPKGEQAERTPAPEKADTPLTADDVKKKLDENKGALQGCIDEALHRDPNLRVGKIHIATTIAPSGAVTAAKIDKRTVDESQLGTCLKRATRRIVFPAFGGDAFEVDIPIVVTAGE